MQTNADSWTTVDEAAGVLTHTYEFAPGATSNSFTARLESGGLMVISPGRDVTRAQVEELQRHGPVEALVANNGFHHLGFAKWRALCPDARCFAAAGASARIAKKSRTAGSFEPLERLQPLLGDRVAVVETPSSKCGETWARVELERGFAWYASDLLANMQLPPKLLLRLLFKWTGSGPGYRPFKLAHTFILRDKRASLRAMLDDVRRHPPSVMVPAHGDSLSTATLAEETERILEEVAR